MESKLDKIDEAVTKMDKNLNERKFFADENSGNNLERNVDANSPQTDKKLLVTISNSPEPIPNKMSTRSKRPSPRLVFIGDTF